MKIENIGKATEIERRLKELKDAFLGLKHDEINHIAYKGEAHYSHIYFSKLNFVGNMEIERLSNNIKAEIKNFLVTERNKLEEQIRNL